MGLDIWLYQIEKAKFREEKARYTQANGVEYLSTDNNLTGFSFTINEDDEDDYEEEDESIESPLYDALQPLTLQKEALDREIDEAYMRGNEDISEYFEEKWSELIETCEDSDLAQRDNNCIFLKVSLNDCDTIIHQCVTGAMCRDEKVYEGDQNLTERELTTLLFKSAKQQIENGNEVYYYNWF